MPKSKSERLLRDPASVAEGALAIVSLLLPGAEAVAIADSAGFRLCGRMPDGMVLPLAFTVAAKPDGVPLIDFRKAMEEWSASYIAANSPTRRPASV